MTLKSAPEGMGSPQWKHSPDRLAGEFWTGMALTTFVYICINRVGQACAVDERPFDPIFGWL
jgi:hypothetical protein